MASLSSETFDALIAFGKSDCLFLHEDHKDYNRLIDFAVQCCSSFMRVQKTYLGMFFPQ